VRLLAWVHVRLCVRFFVFAWLSVCSFVGLLVCLFVCFSVWLVGRSFGQSVSPWVGCLVVCLFVWFGLCLFARPCVCEIVCLCLCACVCL